MAKVVMLDLGRKLSQVAKLGCYSHLMIKLVIFINGILFLEFLMTDITPLIDAGFSALEISDYTTAQNCFVQCLATETALLPSASFNIHYGMALCLFALYSKNPSDTALLTSTVFHAEQATDIYERRYDLQVLLGQCYATQYQLTQDSSFKDKAQQAYDLSRASIPAMIEAEERATLNSRITELITALGDI